MPSGVGRARAIALLILLRDPDSHRAHNKVQSLISGLISDGLVSVGLDRGYPIAELTELGRAQAQIVADSEDASIRRQWQPVKLLKEV